jgi:hypothetical protein
MDPAGTHLPVLKHIVGITTGPVLEMGMGYNSTPILHELCSNRLLVSLDSEAEWVEKFASFRSDSHKIKTEPDWDDTTRYLQSVFWDVILIDHHPCERRAIDIKLLMHNARFMVVHDTEPRAAHVYNYEPALSLFRYRWEFQALMPYTTVVSMTDPIPQSVWSIQEVLNQTGAPIPKLSILIATLNSRAAIKERLVTSINIQCEMLPGWKEAPIKPVEIIELADDGELILGDKRNQLLERASGEYVAFVDDDDMVSDSYVADALAAIDAYHPDCVTFKGIITTNGGSSGEFKFDMDYPHNIWEQDSNGVHMRCPSIWCPIKASIAKSVKFMSVDCAEDRVWAIQIYPLLNTQTYIDKHLYFYRSSTTETSAQQQEKVEKSRRIIGDFRYKPYVRGQLGS